MQVFIQNQATVRIANERQVVHNSAASGLKIKKTTRPQLDRMPVVTQLLPEARHALGELARITHT